MADPNFSYPVRVVYDIAERLFAFFAQLFGFAV